MNHLFNITKKELKELLTPGSLVSMLLVVILLSSLGTLMGGEMESAQKLSPMGVVNSDAGGTYSDKTVGYIRDIYIDSGVKAEDINKYVVILNCAFNDAAIAGAMEEANLKTAVAISPGYSSDIAAGTPGKIYKYFMYSNIGMLASATAGINDSILLYINQTISKELIGSNISGTCTFTPAFLQNPVAYDKNRTCINGTVYEGITPYQIASSTMSQTMMVPIIMMIIITMVGSMIISSMGNEKENKTLETLLTLPVKRTTVVSGKLLASALVGLIYGVAYLFGMSIYLGGMAGGAAGINLADYGLALNAVDWVLIGASVFLSIMSALGICMIMGAFAKNYKAAQTMTMPITILAMIPMIVTMLFGWDALPGMLQAILFAIPFSHPMMATNNLMFGGTALVLGGIVYMIVFSAVMIAITVRIYKSDILITGLGTTKLGQMLGKMGKKKNAE